MYSNVLTILAIALLFQLISGQCINSHAIQNGIGIEEAAASQQEMSYNTDIFRGPGLKVTSFSPAKASGITIQSDNLLIEGPLAVSGQLPFLGVVALDGPLPTVGEGFVAYSCGGGDIGILAEDFGPVAPDGVILAASALGPRYRAGYGPYY